MFFSKARLLFFYVFCLFYLFIYLFQTGNVIALWHVRWEPGLSTIWSMEIGLPLEKAVVLRSLLQGAPLSHYYRSTTEEVAQLFRACDDGGRLEGKFSNVVQGESTNYVDGLFV